MIKQILLFFLLTASLWSIELDWGHDYKKALEISKKENKNIYLFIGADNCRFCERFKKITLSNKDVMKRLRKEYVLLFLNRDHHNIPKKFEKFMVPRHYFLDENAKILYETRGSREVAGFNLLLDEVEIEIE
jgi:thioredoxin-related protein